MYGCFISIPQTQRGRKAPSASGALVTSNSQPHSGFGHTNRWPFLMNSSIVSSPVLKVRCLTSSQSC